MALSFVAGALRTGAGGESSERRAADQQPQRGRFAKQLPPPSLQNRNRCSSGMRSHAGKYSICFICYASEKNNTATPTDRLVFSRQITKRGTELCRINEIRSNSGKLRKPRLYPIDTTQLSIDLQPTDLRKMGLALRVPHEMIDSNKIDRFVTEQYGSERNILESPEPA